MKVNDDKATIVVRGCAGIALAAAPVFAWVGGHVCFAGIQAQAPATFVADDGSIAGGAPPPVAKGIFMLLRSVLPCSIEPSGASAPRTG